MVYGIYKHFRWGFVLFFEFPIRKLYFSNYNFLRNLKEENQHMSPSKFSLDFITIKEEISHHHIPTKNLEKHGLMGSNVPGQGRGYTYIIYININININ